MNFTCYECGSLDYVEAVAEWEARSLEPQDRDNTGILIEHQCRDCARSVWVGSDFTGAIQT